MGDSQTPSQRTRRVRRKSLNPRDGIASEADRRKISLSAVSTFYPPNRTGEARHSRSHSYQARDLPLPQSPSRPATFIEHDSSLPEVAPTLSFPQTVSKASKSWVQLDQLPESVLQCIIQQLRYEHLRTQSSSCRTCYMRDLVALQLTSKRWQRRARQHLYGSIAITGNDSSLQLQRCKLQIGSRLKLLRRTLREHDELAALVTKLHVHDPDIPIFQHNGQRSPTFSHYRDLVASVVMACPNLQRLTGFHCWYNHEYDRLTQALSTRSQLRSHVLIVSENDEVTARSQVQLPPGLLSSTQANQFIHNNCWAELEDLMICSPGNSGIVEHELFVRVLRALPCLKRLCVSSFDNDDFNDDTLMSLPPLQSLRLEECFGVRDAGLIRWAGAPTSASLTTLVLIHQNLQWLLTISKLLASLSHLTKFTLSQTDILPLLPAQTMIFQPVFASASLQHLHWDVDHSQVTVVDTSLSANAHLALSISYGGFPALTSLRAPRDDSPPGALQAVCQPAATERALQLRGHCASQSATVAMPLGETNGVLTRGNSLRAARLRAQNYIEKQRKLADENMQLVITEHPNTDYTDDDSYSSSSSSYSEASTEATDPRDLISPQESKTSEQGPDFQCELSSAIARQVSNSTFGSRQYTTSKTSDVEPPQFDLTPDVQGYELNGGLVGWGDLLRVHEKMKHGGTNRRPPTMQGCMGMWNKASGKSVEQWWHMPRPRCPPETIIEIDHFF